MRAMLLPLLLLTSAALAAGEQARPDQKIRVLLDTDAHNELDDQHAIAYMLFSGDRFDVEGITVNRTKSGGDIHAQHAEAIRVVKLTIGSISATRRHHTSRTRCSSSCRG